MKEDAKSEIINLQKNKIDLKIKNVEGYLIKRSSFSCDLDTFYGRLSKPKICPRSNLIFRYYYCPSQRALYVFTNLTDSNFDFENQHLATNSFVVNIYTSKQDFNYSDLGKYYRFYCNEGCKSYSWDEFGNFETDSPEYNSRPLVLAIKELDSDTIYRDPGQMRKCIFG